MLHPHNDVVLLVHFQLSGDFPLVRAVPVDEGLDARKQRCTLSPVLYIVHQNILF